MKSFPKTQGILRSLVILALLCVVPGCGTYPSVSAFGTGARDVGSSFAELSSHTYELCLLRVDAQHSMYLAKDLFQGETYQAELKDCMRVAKAAPSLVSLGEHLVMYGAALEKLAETSERDYSESVADLSSTVKGFVPSATDKQIESVNALGATVLNWVVSGYTSSKISQAIEESNKFIPQTIDLMKQVLAILDEELIAYEHAVKELSTHPVFSPKAPELGENPTPEEVRAFEQELADHKAKMSRLATLQQGALAKHHGRAALWREQLNKQREALEMFEVVHSAMLEEAQRRKEEWDLEGLVNKAVELRKLAADLKNWTQLSP